MRKNTLKEKLAAGETTLGMTIGFHSPDVIEIVGALGVDYVTLDAEHGPFDDLALLHSIRAAESAGATPLVRLPNDPDLILRVLDAGAQGVHVPGVGDAEEAEDAVVSSRFAPDGARTLYAASRSGGYGLGISEEEFAETSNHETLITVQIDHPDGVDNLAEILEVPGIDIVQVEPREIWRLGGASSLAEAEKVADGLVRQAIAAGKWVSSDVLLDETFDQQVKRLRALGVQMLTASARDFIVAGARRFLSVRGRRPTR